VGAALYLDTSALLRAVLEAGLPPDLAARLRATSLLVTSRLTLVESSRALLRLRAVGATPEDRLAEAEREVDELLARCEIWELTPKVCELARGIVPRTALRTLDALHLATYALARRQITGLELLTADARLRDAVTSV
jgi:predicted nucleic acid-binding protein